MKRYLDYTEEELDELYSKLSEKAQDFVYSDIISDEVATVGKEIGLSIDLWEELNTLVLETILGIIPASMFSLEVAKHLGLSEDRVQTVLKHMDDEIFSVIRDESIEKYTTGENYQNESVGAIYDNSVQSVSVDPYREGVAGKSSPGATPMTKERLDLVDELFTGHKAQAQQETPVQSTPVVGGYRPTGLKPDTPEVAPSSSVQAPDPKIITKETLAKMEGWKAPTEPTPVGHVNIPSAIPIIEDNLEATVFTPKNSEAEKVAVGDDIVTLTVSKGTTPGKLKLTFKKKNAPEAQTTTPANVTQTPQTTTSAKDPYRELL